MSGQAVWISMGVESAVGWRISSPKRGDMRHE